MSEKKKLTLNYLPIQALNDYCEERNKKQEKTDEIKEQIFKKEAEIAELRKKYSEIMKRSIMEEDQSLEGELVDINRKIEETEIEKKVLKDKREAQRKTAEPTVTKEEVVNSFNNDFNSRFNEDIMEPIYQEMSEAKEAALKAAERYKKAVKKHEERRSDVINEIGERYKYKLSKVGIRYEDEKEKYCITEKFARGLKY